jgi:2-amino-1-hydroxyethylphosphonate dioxygenase (glycine-forming)
MTEQTAAKVDELLNALAASEQMAYFGEPVSQLQHALQAAEFALDARSDDEMVVAALLHDIGHIIASDSAHRHEQVGVIDHDAQGEAYLRQLGFSERVIALVGGHVNAKRYLVATNPAYSKALSPASTTTLSLQGGPMSSEEIAAFSANPWFREMIQLRGWDERAKEPGRTVEPLERYRSVLIEVLDNARAQRSAGVNRENS